MRYLKYYVGRALLHLRKRTAVTALDGCQRKVRRGVHLLYEPPGHCAAVVVYDAEHQVPYLLICRIRHYQEHYYRQHDKYFRQESIALYLQKLLLY